jgi:hypothetical protein
MFKGTLIADLFAVVRKAEKSARPALLEEPQSRGPSIEPLVDFDNRGEDRREANSEAK